VSRNNDQVPIYGADGAPRGYRTVDVARRLLDCGVATAARGRKRHIKAIYLKQEDGSTSVRTHVRAGTHYSFHEHLESGLQSWRHKRLDLRDEDGVRFSTQPFFGRVVQDCLVR
jgi:hypothetical protein